MKPFITVPVFLGLMALPLMSAAQTVAVCGGTNALTAQNTQGLSNPSYSMNPGGVTSSNPTFPIVPGAHTEYTLYVTGTNSNSAVVTTSIVVSFYGASFSLTSPQNYSVGCGSKSVAVVDIINATTYPIPGGAVSFTFLPPGSPGIGQVTGVLSTINSASINTPGTWSAVVLHNASSCLTYSTFQITSNTIAPVIDSVWFAQYPLSCANPSTQVFTNAHSGVHYEWLPSNTSGTVETVSANFSMSSFSVVGTLTLEATDANNACSTSTAVQVLQNLYRPTAAIAVNQPTGACLTNSAVLANISQCNIPPGTFFNGGAVLAHLWEGPQPQPTATFVSTYTATTPGIYTLWITDSNNGCTDSASVGLNFKPAAAFTHSVSGGAATFSSSSAGVGLNSIFTWDFGDGSYSNAQHPTHTYQNAGSHLVKLKVENNYPGICVDSIIQSVNISGISCTANSNFSMVPTGTAQVWNAIPGYPWNVSAALWSWGDGSTSNTLYTNHTYSAAGMYNICLSVTVNCVASASSCASYSVYRSSQSAQIISVNVIEPEKILAGVEELTLEGAPVLSIVPNPNSGEFGLSAKGFRGEFGNILVHDISGRIVHAENVALTEGAASISVGVNDLQAGVYFVVLQTPASTKTVKMIVTR